jgi:hypothetical protein
MFARRRQINNDPIETALIEILVHGDKRCPPRPWIIDAGVGKDARRLNTPNFCSLANPESI